MVNQKLKEQYPVAVHAPNFDFLDRMSWNQKMRVSRVKPKINC